MGRTPLGPPVYVDATADDPGYWEFRWRDGTPGSLVWHELDGQVVTEAGLMCTMRTIEGA